MSKIKSTPKKTGMIMGLLYVGRSVIQALKSGNQSVTPTKVLDMKSIDGEKMNKDSRPTVKKSARITKQFQEDIHEVTLSNKDFTIQIVPVTRDEENSKRVKGYTYLSV